MESYIWLIVAAVMGAIEAISFGLITLWFVLGALAAFVANIAGASIIVQIIVFLVVSIASLVLIRPVVMKYRKHGESFEPTPIGLDAMVTEDIDNATFKGRVQTPDRMTWAAVSADGSTIPAGTSVKVVGQESIKLIVERVD